MNNRLPKLNKKSTLILAGVVLATGVFGIAGYNIYKEHKDIRELAHEPDTPVLTEDNVSNNGGGENEGTTADNKVVEESSKGDNKTDAKNDTSNKTNSDKEVNKEQKKKDDVVDKKSMESEDRNSKDDVVYNKNTKTNNSKPSSNTTTNNSKRTMSKQSTPYNTRKTETEHSEVNHKSSVNSTQHRSNKSDTHKSSKPTIQYDSTLTNEVWNAWNNYRASHGVKRLSYSQSEASRSYNTAKEDAYNQSASHGYSQCGLMAPAMSANGIINLFASSEGHRANMLDSHSEAGGVAVFKANDGMIYCVLSYNDGW